MLLKDLTLDGILHGKVTDIQTAEVYGVFTKAVKNGAISKYLTSIKRNQETVGYITYTTPFEEGASSFSGIKTMENYRGCGLSHALMETYFSICEQNGIHQFKTKKQKKPFTVFLLTKYGYNPDYDIPSRKVLVSPGEGSRLRLMFDNEGHMENFLKSNLFRSGQYEIATQNNEPPLQSVQIYSGHHLTNMETFQKRREANRQRFMINI